MSTSNGPEPAHPPIAVVTGGGTGIGAATARLLAARGMAVVLMGRRPGPLEETAQRIAAEGGRAEVFPGDVRDADRVGELAARVTGSGGLDVLVNSAGGQFRAAARDLSLSGWRAVVDTNLTGTFTVTRALFEALRSRRGAIVNVVANLWQGAAPGMAHSGAARAGVVSLTRTLAVEWAGDGIRVNAISPGLTRTAGLVAQVDDLDAMGSRVPLGRVAEPDEVADAIAFLVDATYVTGEVLTIDGGLHLGLS